jgi:hypothetical protein
VSGLLEDDNVLGRPLRQRAALGGITNPKSSPRRKLGKVVFADLGLANPEREQLRAHLTVQIYHLI